MRVGYAVGAGILLRILLPLRCVGRGQEVVEREPSAANGPSFRRVPVGVSPSALSRSATFGYAASRSVLMP